MNDYENAIQLALTMRANLNAMKCLCGANWPSVVKKYRAVIQAAMTKSGDSNPIACALPIAKEMSKRNDNPLLMLAVATEMSGQQTTEGS